MADNIPSLDDLLKSIQEEDDDNIPGLDDLLESIKNEDAPQSSSALAVIPKKPEDLVEEDIDSQILSILGLEEVFDLTYEEYASLLKEAAVKGRMADSQMTTESIELVTNELKRVRNKTGRFKVKPKKVDINKVLDRKQPTPSGAIVKAQKLIPQAAEVAPEQEKKPVVDTENLQEDLLSGIGNILESLITIRTLLSSQGKTEQKAAQEDRKETEKKKKKERESTLEKKKPKSPILKALTKPVDDFFGAIKKFFTNVLLGSVVLGIFKWLKDPKNQQAVDGFANFLQNNAGLILGGLLAIALLPIAPTLLALTSAISTIAIPALTAAFGFLASPAGLAALAGLAATTVVAKGGEMIMQKAQKAFGSTGVTKKGTAFNLGDINALKQEQEAFITQNKYPNEVRNKLIKPYDDLLEELRKKKQIENDIENINKNIAAMPQQEWRWKPELEKKQKELSESSKKTTELFGKLGITDANLKQSQMRRGGRSKDETYVDPSKTKPSAVQNLLGNAQRLLGVSQSTKTVKPVISGRYGEQRSTGAHGGTDLAVDKGTPLTAVSDGEIVDYGDLNQSGAKRGDPGGWGNFLVYKDNQGIYHLYGHIQDGFKKSGRVKKGEQIAKVGMTGRTSGPHLHWEAGTAWSGGSLTGKFDPLNKYSSTAPFSLDPSASTSVQSPAPAAPAAQVAKTPAPTPSIPSPTGRGNIVPLPIPTGGGAQQASSGTAPNQAPVPRFSSEDPNNTTTMVVRAIYNIVG